MVHLVTNNIEPQTSVPPRVRDGESIGSKKFVTAKGITALLCDAQSNPSPKFVYVLQFLSIQNQFINC